ncbi:MAG: MarC family protein [Thermoplasmata archaeon]|nr:MarC family protein [Thermoplasmata archaeon]MCI4358881.1 MarC family protein [Thermoplasmata archaeon]
MNDLAFLAAVVVSVFALVDPIGTLPFFVALTDGMDAGDRMVVLTRATIVVGTILAIFALFGRFLFAAFGFTLQAFEIAGGILLFLVAYDMLRGEVATTRLTASDREEALARRDEISVVPLGIPLLAGPGAISTVMIYEGYAGSDPIDIAATFIAIAATTAATYLVLRYGPNILRYLGRVGVMALTRVMGLLLAAIAVQFILNGILAFLGHAGIP